MTYAAEFDVWTFNWWSGAKGTIAKIKYCDKMEELQSYLEELFYDTTPTATQINDAVWFGRDEICKALDI